jgi:outer membrane protein assembly factor BamB
MSPNDEMKRFQPWCILIVAIIGCGSISDLESPQSSPTIVITPSIPPRRVGWTNDFPWQEKWHLPIWLDDNTNYRSNIRNLIAFEEGLIFVDNPLNNSQNFGLKLVTSERDVYWMTELNGTVDSIVSDGNIVYAIGYLDRQIQAIAYDRQTAKLIWQSKIFLPDHRGYDLLLRGQSLYAYSSISTDPVYRFDIQTGELVERLSFSGLKEDAFVVFQFDNQDLLQEANEQLMLTRGEQVIWQTPLSPVVFRFPELYHNLLIVKFEERKHPFQSLAGIDKTTGEIVWHRSNIARSNFVVVDDVLYLVNQAAKIMALDPKNGETLGWVEVLPLPTDLSYTDAAITVYEDSLYVYFRDSLELIAFQKIND